MAEWMYAYTLPGEDHPEGCRCGGCDTELNQIRNLEDDSPRCNNCIDTVYMDHCGDGLYRCPVCGDEIDTQYPQDDPFPGLGDE